MNASTKVHTQKSPTESRPSPLASTNSRITRGRPVDVDVVLELMQTGSGEALAGILNDILDFSKIEANKLDFEWELVDVGRVVQEMLPLLLIRAHQKNLQLLNHVPTAPSSLVWGDRGRIRQVLFNLVGNARKFTSEGSVQIRAETLNARMHRFEIVDTGVGIPDEHQPRLFELFSQADATTSRRFGGTGLGLAISRRLVELMGGSIGFSSTPGKGTTFWFTLPNSATATTR